MTAAITTTRPLTRGVSPLAVLRLHLTQRVSLAVTPVGIIGVVFAITAIINVIWLQVGSVPGSAGWLEGSRSNPAMLWALPGFLGWLGVQTVSLTFPLALSLGSSRRAFTLGTLATHLLISTYLTVLMLVLLGLEKLTDQWFLNLYVIDVFILGAGDVPYLILITFLASLLVLSVGGAMAAAWVRFGAIGPTALSVGSLLILGALAILVVPIAITSFELWWLLAGALTMIALAVTGQYLFLLRASAR